MRVLLDQHHPFVEPQDLYNVAQWLGVSPVRILAFPFSWDFQPIRTFAETPVALISLLENHLESNGNDNGSVGDMEKEWMDWQEGCHRCLHPR
jgi:hypothetical protein